LKLPNRTPIKKPAPGVKRNLVLEEPFAQWLSFKGIKFVKQFKPIDGRNFRCDFYLPDYNTIIEIEGGQWVNGRHQRGFGFKQDIEKYNEIAFAGYHLIRLTTDHFMRTSAKSYMVSGYSATILDRIIGTFYK